MGREIERKFLVTGDSWRNNAQEESCCQGYICLGKGPTVRVRIIGGRAFLTVKGESRGIVRNEYEYSIPVPDAQEMLDHVCEKPFIEKKRYTVKYKGMIWEVDEFFGENEGLIVAEVELENEDQLFPLPGWVGKEVTGDPRFYNVSLVRNPYAKWKGDL